MPRRPFSAGTGRARGADDPLSLMTKAASAALDDVGAAARREHRPSRGRQHPHVVVRRRARRARRDVWVPSPPSHLHDRSAATRHSTLRSSSCGGTRAGRCRAVLLAGGEAGASTAKARRSTTTAPTSGRSERSPQRWTGIAQADQYGGTDIRAVPARSAMYPLIETAIRAPRRPLARGAPGVSRCVVRTVSPALLRRTRMRGFATAHAAERIATPTPDNRYVGYPYTKLMNAIIAVDQAAAVVLTTEAACDGARDRPESLGVSDGRRRPQRRLARHRAARVRHGSPAIRAAARHALDQAGCRIDEMTALRSLQLLPRGGRDRHGRTRVGAR